MDGSVYLRDGCDYAAALRGLHTFIMTAGATAAFPHTTPPLCFCAVARCHNRFLPLLSTSLCFVVVHYLLKNRVVGAYVPFAAPCCRQRTCSDLTCHIYEQAPRSRPPAVYRLPYVPVSVRVRSGCLSSRQVGVKPVLRDAMMIAAPGDLRYRE